MKRLKELWDDFGPLSSDSMVYFSWLVLFVILGGLMAYYHRIGGWSMVGDFLLALVFIMGLVIVTVFAVTQSYRAVKAAIQEARRP